MTGTMDHPLLEQGLTCRVGMSGAAVTPSTCGLALLCGRCCLQVMAAAPRAWAMT